MFIKKFQCINNFHCILAIRPSSNPPLQVILYTTLDVYNTTNHKYRTKNQLPCSCSIGHWISTSPPKFSRAEVRWHAEDRSRSSLNLLHSSLLAADKDGALVQVKTCGTASFFKRFWRCSVPV